MGSIFASAPTPPAPPPPATTRNEVAGVEQIPVKNPDGSYTYITRELAKTETELAEEKKYKDLMSEALAEIQKLSSSDYAFDDETRAILDSWEDERKGVVNEIYDTRVQQEHNALARRGLSDSSAAESIARQTRLDEQKAQKQIQNETSAMKQDMRNQQLQLQYGLYNMASAQENADDVQAFQSAVQGQSSAMAMENSRQASLMDYYRNQQAVAAQNRQQTVGMMSMAGGMAGMAYGGPAGAAFGQQAGGFLGNTLV